jgi:hypothetical protein
MEAEDVEKTGQNGDPSHGCAGFLSSFLKGLL